MNIVTIIKNSKLIIVAVLFLGIFLKLNLLPQSSLANNTEKANIDKNLVDFCNIFNAKIKQYNWNKIVCNPKTWQWDKKYITPKGNPLVYQAFLHNPTSSTTLILCGVHGDELPSSYQCIHLVRDIVFDNPALYKNSNVVIAPLVNPDGFFAAKPTRQNSNGIDLNRNFPTKDFDLSAIVDWKKDGKSNPRKYPGSKGGSEIETQFQVMLLDKFHPDKIISIHSPYGWLDIDATPKEDPSMDEPEGMQFGPFKSLFETANALGKEMSKKSNNFPIANFRVFPGSLGNYAANERRIPTYTVELKTSSAFHADSYWKIMRSAYIAAIKYKIPKELAKKREDLSTSTTQN
ncbi:MAG: hypothetical protein A2504_01700 [Bdellovibrionales bacterium RIFOXYD12_FULL_39_22]|nr:MAG: hypothetical protein A2385_04225 [Bdellovibrionales bacterium RIFOXYB1_FULL_39_21]OFZ42380.1 MAG: hypothetical protein A2485_15270 [Bdellovibrionales bacterium RIFOXYC12_FULL_39_17]OFZ46319.1 MAG: hypothetical protein A2404_13745 [Bdellovibrionales bacterium RIFOXYC1_FULL_39_130]OFZ71486.1 MAG: hypothetical protein A2451_04380 [Bdellovibrionales bacterium RIFOXYC2_FULL_39_8]OFZ75212.1 MAG: hypothetical protein A2560_15800 [Bdellovibrionales bacterium RIFOXYD1_FULL_39_84]OFZ93206.1 MAG: